MRVRHSLIWILLINVTLIATSAAEAQNAEQASEQRRHDVIYVPMTSCTTSGAATAAS